MVNPVTGPLATTQRTSFNGAYSWIRSGSRYRQKPPYNLNLPYNMWRRQVLVDYGEGVYSWRTNQRSPDDFDGRAPARAEDLSPNSYVLARNKARSSFHGMMQESLDGLTALVELKKSYGMLATRFLQGRNLIRAVKRGRWADISDALVDITGYRHQAAARRASKVREAGGSLGSAMLEVYFGWVPILADIQAAMENLSKEPPYGEVKGKGKYGPWNSAGKQRVGNTTIQWWDTGEIRVKCGAEVWVDNPNLYFANKFGLVNPLATAWEVFPWSFVIDYFFSVGDCIEAMSSDVGLRYENQWSVEITKTTKSYIEDYLQQGISGWGRHTLSSIYWNVTRSTSIPSVRLGVKEWSFGKDYSRVVTSLSLLLQQLR